jgi:D-aminopeptidase
MDRERFRDLGLTIGKLQTGKNNAITDVEGVLVGHSTIYDKGNICTGLTVILPHNGKLKGNHAPVGFFSYNGTGEFTGSHWIKETGTLATPIAFTGSHILGSVHEHISRCTRKIETLEPFSISVVGETWDGWLSCLEDSRIDYKQVEDTIINACSGPVEEGNIGGGTGMICYEFKGGIGTSSRIVNCDCGKFTIGVLVQANFGRRQDLVINGIPVGEKIGEEEVSLPWDTPLNNGSLLVAIATDAPLLPIQCQRLTRRGALAMGRLGGIGEEGSGDFFIAFSNSNGFSYDMESPVPLKMFPPEQMDDLFEGVVEAVTEAIVNSMCKAETIEGQKGRKAYALPLDKPKTLFK